MFTALLVIAILVLLIVAHEFGHFIAAKISRVRVEEFGVGYPPRAFTFGKIGDTEYTLNWIPFGGFVRLYGDEGEEQHGRGSLVDSPRWKQAIILVAGVAMNAVAAWALFTLALHLGVPQRVDAPAPNQPVELIVTDVVAGSPADSAGLKPGDQIIGLVDSKGMTLSNLMPDTVLNFVKGRGGQVITLSYLHAGAASSAKIRPANAVIPNAAGRPGLGIGLVLVALKSLPWGDAAQEALFRTVDTFVIVAGDLWTLVRGALQGAPNLSGVIGPVGIVGYVGQAAQSGFGSVLILAALISVNLAIINLIPIPALDGGRLLVLAIEALMGRDAPRLAIQILNALGIGVILLLMFIVTYHDIARLLA